MTNIEDNGFLHAPLAKSAGGSQLCGRPVFKTKNDPDYQAILKTFEPITGMLKEKPRIERYLLSGSAATGPPLGGSGSGGRGFD